jgi:hypothetical protein
MSAPVIRNPRPAVESDRSPYRRQPKSVIPPDVVDGQVQGRPAIMRQARLRFAAKYHPGNKTRKASKHAPKPHEWKPLEISIPREVVESAGWEQGMMINMESYVDGRIRMYPAGDVLTREEEMI